VGDPSSTAGAGVAAADVTGSGTPEIITGSVLNGQATVQVLKFTDGSVIESFNPFTGFTGNLSVAAADVNGDGTPDIIVGAGAGGSPRVQVIDGKNSGVMFDQLVFESTFTGGVNVTTGDLNGDGKPEVVIAAGFLGGPRVTAYDPTTWQVVANFFAYDSTQRAGVQVAVFDAEKSGSNAIVTTDGQGQSGGIAAFDGKTQAALTAPTSFTGIPVGTSTASTSTSPPTTPPTSPPPTSPPVSNLNTTMPDPNSSNWQTQSNGLKIWDVSTGSGTAVSSTTANVSVFYVGFLVSNGTVFDSSTSSPASFSTSGVIAGFQQGLIGMQPGGIRYVFIPSALGYGAAGSPPKIPANSDLIFEIQLVSAS
jgi:hypothetical protein